MVRKYILRVLCVIFWVIPIVLEAHSGDTLDVRYGTTPTIDGTFSSGEWDDAYSFILTSYVGGNVATYVKHDATNLYIAFDAVGWGVGWVIFDVAHNGGNAPQTDDCKLILESGTMKEEKGTGSGWTPTSVSGWTASGTAKLEYSISFAKLGITPGNPKTIGGMLAVGGEIPWENFYPPELFLPGYFDFPGSWADICSGDNWGPGPGVEEALLPCYQGFLLFSCYPNPFCKEVNIAYQVHTKSRISLNIYNITGELVKVIVDRLHSPGYHLVKWDGKDNKGEFVPSGIYFVKLKIDDKFSQTQKLLLLR